MRMDLLDLFPISTQVKPEHGGLWIGECNLSSLAQEWGTPLYLYDAATLQTQARLIRRLLGAAYPGPSLVAYAAKTYFSFGMARKLSVMGLGVDCVSLAELDIARQAGFPPGKAHLHGNNKSSEELEAAMDWGIQSIVVDSLEELGFLEDLAQHFDRCNVRIWLRVTPGLTVDTHPYRQTGHTASKFGLPLQDGQAAEAIRRAMASQRLKLVGLHTHLGSQLFEAEPYQEALRSLGRLAYEQGFVPEEISPGGGWGVPYHPDDPLAPVERWIEGVSQTTVSMAKEYGWPLPRLVLEPGRWLVARAGVALYTLGTTKILPDGSRVAAVDGGMADNPRPALYQSRYTACLAERPLAQPVQNWRVVGKYCESGDLLIQDVPLPEFLRGDLLAMPVSGAYQLSMASNYNLAPRPAVLWLEHGQVECLQVREKPSQAGWWSGGGVPN